MIAPCRIARDEWETLLRSYGCEPLEGKGRLNTAEYWRMPFQSYPFTVPNEGGYVTQADLDYLINLIATSAPPDWEFPDQ